MKKQYSTSPTKRKKKQSKYCLSHPIILLWSCYLSWRHLGATNIEPNFFVSHSFIHPFITLLYYSLVTNYRHIRRHPYYWRWMCCDSGGGIVVTVASWTTCKPEQGYEGNHLCWLQPNIEENSTVLNEKGEKSENGFKYLLSYHYAVNLQNFNAFPRAYNEQRQRHGDNRVEVCKVFYLGVAMTVIAM